MSRNGTPWRKYSFNEHAFDEPSEASNYWMGFLITDGYISSRPNGKFMVGCCLSHKDSEHLAKMKSFLSYSGPLSFVHRKANHLVKSAGSAIRVSITCTDHFADTLLSRGLVPRKTFTADARSMATCQHFWRGAVDGDGCVRLVMGKRYDYPEISLASASTTFIDQYRSFAMNQGAHVNVYKNGNCYTAKSCGVGAINIIRSLYGGCSVALERKNATAQSVIERSTSDPLWCKRQGRPRYRRPIVYTPELRLRMSLAQRGKKHSPEVIARRSHSMKKLKGLEPDIVSRYLSGEGMVPIARFHGVFMGTIRRILTESGVTIRPKGQHYEKADCSRANSSLGNSLSRTVMNGRSSPLPLRSSR